MTREEIQRQLARRAAGLPWFIKGPDCGLCDDQRPHSHSGNTGRKLSAKSRG